MEWFKNWFNQDYLLLYPDRDDSEARGFIDFLANYFNQQNYKISSLVDLGCGAGRHLKYLAQYYRFCWGIDYSEDLLNIAAKTLSAEGAKNTFLIKADIRNLPFADNSFDLCCSLFTSFGYLETDQQHLNLLAEWRRITKNQAYLIIDFLNSKNSTIFDTRLKTRKIGNIIVEEYKEITADKKRVVKKISMIESNKKKDYYESVRLYSKEEMIKMLNQNSFEIKEVFGDYSGETFKKDSERLILIAKAI